MSMAHPPRFLKLCDEIRAHVVEVTTDEVAARLAKGDAFELVDVREESEFAGGRIKGARHLGKGVIERDIETKIPNHNDEIVLYCGGGYRSALAALNLKKMGYTRVISMDGGMRAWREAGYPIEK